MPEQSKSEQRAQMHRGAGQVLNTRTLEASHRRLAELLRPGMKVLDAGCGTGAITRGIADAVGPAGQVLGIDINLELIAEARERHGAISNLRFEVLDVHTAAIPAEYDIVTAARVLQWLANPGEALRKMKQTVRPGGCVLVLDYNHEKASWDPNLPESMKRFYAAFLHWRADAGMDNALADHLPDLFRLVGLENVQWTPQHEVIRPGDTGFAEQIRLWGRVAASRGHQVVADGFLSEAERARAEREMDEWTHTARRQSLYMLAVEGYR